MFATGFESQQRKSPSGCPRKRTPIHIRFRTAVYAHSAIADQIAKDQYIVLPTQIATALPSFMKKVEQGSATHHIGFLGGELRC